MLYKRFFIRMTKRLLFNALPKSIALVAVAWAAASCINEEYDFNNGIDTTVTIKGDISAPIGNTSFMLIGDFLNLEDESASALVKEENGDYSVRLSGEDAAFSYTVPTVEITDFFQGDALTVKVDAPYNEIDLEDHDLSEFVNGDSYYFPTTIITLPDKFYELEIPSADLPIEINEEIPEEITGISSISLDAEINVTVKINAGPLHTSDNFIMDFPDYFTFEAADGQTIGEGNKFSLAATFSPDSPTTYTFRLKEIDFSGLPDGQGLVNGHLVIHDRVTVGAENGYTFSINPHEMQVRSETFPASIEMDLDVSLPEITISSVTAAISPDITVENQTFEISGLPESLTGENIVLDIWNPQIQLDITNPSPFTLNLSAELVAYKGEAITANVSIGTEETISVKPGVETIFLSRRGADIPQTMVGTNFQDIVIENLTDLIKDIPDSVLVKNIRLTVAEEYGEIQPGTEYSFAFGYSLYAPLAVGPDMKLETSLDLTGLQGDSNSGTEDTDGDGVPDTTDGTDSGSDFPDGNAVIELMMTYVNIIPIDMSIRAVPIDKDGNEMADASFSVEVEGGIDAGSQDNPSESPVTIRMTLSSSEVLDDLDGVMMYITASAPKDENLLGIPLNAAHGMQGKDIVLKINGEISATL